MLKDLHSGTPPDGGDAIDFIGDEGLMVLWTRLPRPVRLDLLKPIKSSLTDADYEALLEDELYPVAEEWLRCFLRLFFYAHNVDGWRNFMWTRVPVSPSSLSSLPVKEGNAMDNRIKRKDSHQSAGDIETGKLVRYANENPKEFGGEVLGVLNAYNIKPQKLAEAFDTRNILPNDVRNLMPWLQGNHRPSWTVKHIEEILIITDTTPKYFFDRSKKEEVAPSGPASSSSAPAASQPVLPVEAPAPEKRVLSAEDMTALSEMRVLSIDNVKFMQTFDTCLRVEGVTSAELAVVFKAAKLMPAEEAYCEKWRKGGTYYYVSNDHLVVTAEVLGVSIPDFLLLLKSHTVEDVTVPGAIEKEDRNSFGDMLRLLMDISNKTGAKALHDNLLAKGVVGRDISNIYQILSGKRNVLVEQFDGIADYFGFTPEQLKAGFEQYKSGGEPAFKDWVKAGAPAGDTPDADGADSAPAEEASGAGESAADVTDADAASDETAEADAPAAEEAAPEDGVAEDIVQTVTDAVDTAATDAEADAAEAEAFVNAAADEPVAEEADDVTEADAKVAEPVADASATTLEDDLQGVLTDYDATRPVAPKKTENKPVNEETVVKEPVVEVLPAVTPASWLPPQKINLDAYSANETAVLKIAHERFNTMTEPERAKVLMGLVTSSDINPELVSGFAFSLMVAHLANIDGAERDKGLVTLFAKSVGMDVH